MMIVIGYSRMYLSSSAPPPTRRWTRTLRRHLHTGRTWTRAVWHTPVVLWPAFSSQVALTWRRLLRTAHPYNGTKFIRGEKLPDESRLYIETPTHWVMNTPRTCSPAVPIHNNTMPGGDIKGYDVPYDKRQHDLNMPTQWENIKFFFSYQLNWMYWRYSCGTSPDARTTYKAAEKLNTATGITGIPSSTTGWWATSPSCLRNWKTTKGHNVFYCLPLLGIIRPAMQQTYRGQKGIQQFWVVFFLFFMTGIAIVLYLNQTPSQPRERDHAYAGSFYASPSDWYGCGGTRPSASRLCKMEGTACRHRFRSLPLCPRCRWQARLWDDHDRSDRYMARDFGQNYLMSPARKRANPIIYIPTVTTIPSPSGYQPGDRGSIADVRTCNLSYLQTDWYIDQMKRPPTTVLLSHHLGPYGVRRRHQRIRPHPAWVQEKHRPALCPKPRSRHWTVIPKHWSM